MLLLIEFCLAVLVILAAFIVPRFGHRYFVKIEISASRFAARRGRAVVTILLLSLGARLAVLPVEPIPQPGVHDEFSYLLMADTFAHGRLTNRVHPMWVHFETFHVNQRPTYCSAYYPAQGLFLALGKITLGEPFWGVWISTGLMCAAICWGLQGWLPPAWAFLGGILAILRIGTFSYWADSYWGGSVGAIGGALVLGALPRIPRYKRVRDTLLMGLGLAILGNSRPYETLFYAAPILIVLLVFTLGREAAPFRVLLRRVILPLGIVLTLTMAWMAYYFWRTTSHPLRTPYSVNISTYGVVPFFPWQVIRPVPEFRHQVMKDFYLLWTQVYLQVRQHPIVAAVKKSFTFWAFFVGPALSIPFFFVAAILPSGMSIRQLGSKTQILLVIALISFCGSLLPIYFHPHYAAPLTCATFALILQALRRVRMWDRHRGLKGLFVVRTVVLLCSATFLLAICGLVRGASRSGLFSFEPSRSQNTSRAQLIRYLDKREDKNLIIVRYSPGHVLHDEWVYNAADIDSSKVVWAREMTPSEDKELTDYFNNRRHWLLNADERPPRLVPLISSQISAEKQGVYNAPAH